MRSSVIVFQWYNKLTTSSHVWLKCWLEYQIRKLCYVKCCDEPLFRQLPPASWKVLVIELCDKVQQTVQSFEQTFSLISAQQMTRLKACTRTVKHLVFSVWADSKRVLRNTMQKVFASNSASCRVLVIQGSQKIRWCRCKHSVSVT